jgi:lantibiotic modifying enzyme
MSSDKTGAIAVTTRWMARLRAYEVLGVDWLLADAEAALGSTIADLESRVTAPLSNLCLCHGVAGNVDLLLLAARILNRAPLVDTARRLSALAWDACDAAEVWPCGPKMATGIAAPFAGLMAGLAGLGYSRLRLLAPDRIPSTLMPSPCVLASAVRTDVIAGVPTT